MLIMLTLLLIEDPLLVIVLWLKVMLLIGRVKKKKRYGLSF